MEKLFNNRFYNALESLTLQEVSRELRDGYSWSKISKARIQKASKKNYISKGQEKQLLDILN